MGIQKWREKVRKAGLNAKEHFETKVFNSNPKMRDNGRWLKDKKK